MDYRNTTKINLVFFCLCLLSCGTGEKKHPDVDSFYTQKRFGQQFALVPLIKPIKLGYDTDMNTWGFHPSSSFFGFSVYNASTEYIGVQEPYVYGKIEATEKTYDNLKPDDIIYARTKGGTLISKDESKNYGLRIEELEDKPNTYLWPERWFIIDAAEGKGEGFFDKSEYLEQLKRKRIEGKMYNSDSLLTEFQKTGILEYFPDSIKTKLRN